MGTDGGTVAAARFCPFLAGPGESWSGGAAAREKNFVFCKNFVCICGKMGYNKV
ncbi:MAG: hypothetical protein UEP57_07305 [Oscillospiraceae bacterium]|nr:hypothetical protein [Oscillospiraceae bacterium]